VQAAAGRAFCHVRGWGATERGLVGGA